MELQEIDINISPKGQVKISVKGARGSECLAITKEIEELLGGTILSRVITPEGIDTNKNLIDIKQKSGK